MKKKATATAAEKAEAPKPAEIPKDPKRPVMTADLKLEFGPLRVTPPNRGPMTGESAMNAADFVAQYGRPEEFERWRREIVERRAKDTTTWAWEKCDHCGLVMKVRPDSQSGGPCPRNWQRRADLGHLRRMNEAEVNEHLYQQAARDKAKEERLRRAAFYARNAERAKAGLAPLSYEEFARLQKAVFAQMKQRGKELGDVAGLYRGRS